MIAAAEALGFREYGLSDHLVLHPELPDVEWAMPLRLVDEYASAVRMAARAVGDRLRVRVGVEVDFSPDNPRRVELERILDRCGFDFRIGSIHYLGRFPVDGNAADWERLSPGERDEMHRGYWLTVKALAEQAEVDWIGHLDLPKKFGFAGRDRERRPGGRTEHGRLEQALCGTLSLGRAPA
jgi:HisJ family histidinol phosphate phosphatase